MVPKHKGGKTNDKYTLEVTLNFSAQNKVNSLQARKSVATQRDAIPEIQSVVLDGNHQEHVARQLVVQDRMVASRKVLVVEEAMEDDPGVPKLNGLRRHLVDVSESQSVQQHLDIRQDIVKTVQQLDEDLRTKNAHARNWHFYSFLSRSLGFFI